MVALTQAPSFSPPTTDPARFAFHIGTLRSSFIEQGKCKLKPRNDPKHASLLWPWYPRVYQHSPRPPAPARSRSGGAAFPSRLPPPNPRASSIRVCLAQRQDMTYRRMGMGGHLRTGPRRIGCRASHTLSPGPGLPAPAKISGCGRSTGCGRVPAAAPPGASRVSWSERASGRRRLGR